MRAILPTVVLLMATFTVCAQEVKRSNEVAIAATNEASKVIDKVVDAPKTKLWTLSGLTGINLAATTLLNWTAGGSNSASGLLYANLTLLYKKDRIAWENHLDTEIGLMHMGQTTFPWRKSNDKLNFNSKYGYRVAAKWYATIMAGFKSQYTYGYDYTTVDGAENKAYTSNWLSPSYTDISLGMDWQPNSIISAYFSPIAGRITSVTVPELRERYGLDADKSTKTQIGMTLKGSLNYYPVSNLKILSTLSLFTPYANGFGNFDVDWSLMVSYQFLKVLTASLMTNLKYYDGVQIANKDGHYAQRIQLKNVIGVGVGYSF